MDNMKTKITFCFKNDEPVLESIVKEFSQIEFIIEKKYSENYTVIFLTIESNVDVIDYEYISLDGSLCQFESISFIN